MQVTSITLVTVLACFQITAEKLADDVKFFLEINKQVKLFIRDLRVLCIYCD